MSHAAEFFIASGMRRMGANASVRWLDTFYDVGPLARILGMGGNARSDSSLALALPPSLYRTVRWPSMTISN